MAGLISLSPRHIFCAGACNTPMICSRARSSASDLTKQQFTVLAAVEQNEGISQTDLVALTGIDRSTLAEMIRRMIDKGLLDRERTESDQRANAVRIAAGGKKALRSARSANDRVERMLLSGLSSGDRAKFVKMLAIVASQGETSQSAPRVDGRRVRRARYPEPYVRV